MFQAIKNDEYDDYIHVFMTLRWTYSRTMVKGAIVQAIWTIQ